MIKAEEYKARRNKLFEKMDEGSTMILLAGVPKKSSADEFYDFEVNRNFYYLTGVTQDDSALILIKGYGENREFLFIPYGDPLKEKWYGKRLRPEEAEAKSGIKNVLINTGLESKIETILSSTNGVYGKINTVYFDMEPEQKIADCTAVAGFVEETKKKYSGFEVKDAYKMITSLRKIKSPAEIEEFREAIAHTALGVKAVMLMARPGVKEYELTNEFLKVVNDDSGYQGLAFPTIMATGINATCLHYPTPFDTVRKGECVLMDLGARHNLYCADVTRVIPADGKFNELHKSVYEIVLACNKAVAEMAKPGLTIKDLQEFTKNYLASECLLKGFISSKEEIDKYYFHNVSHHIGLDTHDPMDRAEVLEPGCVISDEPGLYMADRGIGVRIEDDLLITEDGCEVLTKDIIKEVKDIEAFYRH